MIILVKFEADLKMHVQVTSIYLVERLVCNIRNLLKRCTAVRMLFSVTVPVREIFSRLLETFFSTVM